MRRRGCGSSVTVKPRNDRCHGLATALFCALTRSLRRPSMKRGQACHDPVAGLFTADIDVAVIRISHESVATTLKFAIQFIQHEIREQWRKRAALRGAFPAGLE